MPSIYTITLDNDDKFAAREKMAKAINANIYFAKSYTSYQRGINGNTNGITRITWPNKMTLDHLTEADVRTVEVLLNTMPRKIVGGRTSTEVYTGQSDCTYCLNPVTGDDISDFLCHLLYS